MLNLTLILRKYTLDFTADKVPILQLWNQRMSKQSRVRKCNLKTLRAIRTQRCDRTAVLVCKNMCAWDNRSTAEARLEFMSILRGD